MRSAAGSHAASRATDKDLSCSRCACQQLQAIDESNRNVLLVYLQDVSQKLLMCPPDAGPAVRPVLDAAHLLETDESARDGFVGRMGAFPALWVGPRCTRERDMPGARNRKGCYIAYKLISLGGTLCHHVESGASRFITSMRLSRRACLVTLFLSGRPLGLLNLSKGAVLGCLARYVETAAADARGRNRVTDHTKRELIAALKLTGRSDMEGPLGRLL